MNRWLAVTLTTFALAALAPPAHADANQFADAIYEHIGGLVPEQSRPVPPLPDATDAGSP